LNGCETTHDPDFAGDEQLMMMKQYVNVLKTELNSLDVFGLQPGGAEYFWKMVIEYHIPFSAEREIGVFNLI